MSYASQELRTCWKQLDGEADNALRCALDDAAERMWQSGIDLIARAQNEPGPWILTAFGPVSVTAIVNGWEENVWQKRAAELKKQAP